MRRNNIRLLTDDEYTYLKNKYDIKIRDNLIEVKTKNFNRITLHNIDESFFISVPKIRKITFTVDSINIWKELYDKYCLIDIQKAVNILSMTFQEINSDNVINILKTNK